MRLAVDVGNTETVIGILEDLEVRHFWRTATEPRRTGDEIGLFLRALLEGHPDLRGALERSVIASVVPALDRAWDEVLARLELPSLRVHPGTPLPIRLDVEEPTSVGADRIVNTLAVAKVIGRDTVVVDIGTATTFDCITADGTFIGGVIAPGPRAGLERLVEIAAQLPSVEIRRPERVIGRRTVACLDSGVFYSVVDGIDGIVRRILAEWSPSDPLVVATGGLAELLAPHCETVERVEPHLTLLGLACADAYVNEEPTRGRAEGGE